MLKARLGTHSGSIQSFLTPHHIEIKCDDLDEVCFFNFCFVRKKNFKILKICLVFG